ncbi:MAG: large conductance mechanosensitive channel protein MscL [Clostridia bacterium]|nr:large conductance mechanosensitive channel protein MscL [Clostridia bacterium]
MKKFFEEFKAFALKGNVLDLSVAVIIGAAFQAIISSVVDDLINPLLGLILGGINFSNLYIPLKSADTVIPNTDGLTVGKATLEQLKENGIGVFNYGSFITAVINFIIMALVIFFLVKGINKLTSLGKKKAEPAAPTTKKCPFCQSEIDIKASRCPHCTSEIKE